MVLLQFVNCQQITCNFSQPHIKLFQNLNSLSHLYTITFLCVTFAAHWTGTYNVVAAEYDRYFIVKYSPFDSDDGKYVI